MNKTMKGDKQNHHTFHPEGVNGYRLSSRSLGSHTFMFADLLSLGHLSLGLADPSPKVQRAARHMQPSALVMDETDESLNIYAQSSAAPQLALAA